MLRVVSSLPLSVGHGARISLEKPRMSSLSAANALHNHSTGRWLYNNDQRKLCWLIFEKPPDLLTSFVPAENYARQAYFDMEQLQAVACEAMHATKCIHASKIAEGSYNKVFRLHFEDGRTAVARIPSPRLLGNASMVTASEVATMEFMRLHTTFDVPAVYAWSKNPTNPVRSEYILMEDVRGVPLLESWYSISGSPVSTAVLRLVNNVYSMSTVPFSQIGSIYFKEDLPQELQSRPLFGSTIVEQFRPAESQFRIGPIADYSWWRTMHDENNLDRGPWGNIEEFFIAAANLEQRTVQRYQMNAGLLSSTRSSSLHDLKDAEALLEKVRTLAPTLQSALYHPLTSASLTGSVAVHADLGPNNLMVPADDGQNTVSRMERLTYIDWQGTSALPLALQMDVPAVVQYDGTVVEIPSDLSAIPWPSDMDTMSEDEREYVRFHHRLASRQLGYTKTMFKNFPAWAVLHTHSLYPWISQLPSRILRLVADGPVMLRECLINICDNWQEKKWGACPISFTDDERGAHQAELSSRQLYERNIEETRRAIGTDADGWVSHEDYEEAQKRFENARRNWDSEACGGPWPFENGSWSFFLT